MSLDFERPLTTVDVAIFCVLDDALQVLLIRRPNEPPFTGGWALPGGFIDIEKDNSLQACALRKLREKTGIRAPYLEQVGSWGDNKRDPRGWSATHVYFALVRAQGPQPKAGSYADDAQWVPILSGRQLLPKHKLAFDHDALLIAALNRLRAKVEYTSLPSFLVPEEFTLPQLQRCYEIVLGRPLDKSAFRTRVMSVNLIEATGRTQAAQTRPAQLYRLTDATQPVFFQRPFDG